MIHLGNRTLAAGGIRNWNTTCPTGSSTAAGQNGLRPTWINNDDQTTPQSSDLSAFGAVFGQNTQIGILYHVSNVDVLSGTTPQPCFFDVVLTFSDSTSVTVPVQATDWFGTNTEVLPGHTNTDGSGLETQHVLGIYHGVQNTDPAPTDDGGTGGAPQDRRGGDVLHLTPEPWASNPVGKTLQFITFQESSARRTAARRSPTRSTPPPPSTPPPSATRPPTTRTSAPAAPPPSTSILSPSAAQPAFRSRPPAAAVLLTTSSRSTLMPPRSTRARSS